MALYKGNKKIAGLVRSEDVSHATETHAGIIEIATQGEVLGGASDTKAVTPTKLKQYYYDKVSINSLLADKQNKLVPGANIIIDEATNTISASGGLSEVSWGGITGEIINQTDLINLLNEKQATIEDLDTIRSNASDGATAKSTIDTHMADTTIHVTSSDKIEWSQKQDAISDLEDIRRGANLGATALQSYTETDPIYEADKPNIALKSEIPDISEKQDKLIAGESITIDPDTNTISASISWGDISGTLIDQSDLSDKFDTKQDTIEDLVDIRDNASNAKSLIDTHAANDLVHVSTTDRTSWDSKQEVISDLETIRANAQAGADIIPQVNSNTQRIEDLTVSKFPNATPIGKPQVQDSFVSGFSDSIYMIFPFTDISRGLPFDIYFSFTTDSDVITQQNILDSYFGMALAIANGKGLMAISTNGTNWESGSITGTSTINPNTTYYAKLSWTGTQFTTALSTDDQTYTPDMAYDNSNSPHKTPIYIGGSPNLFGPGSAHPFKGTINFKGARVYLPTLGIDVWEGMADVGLGSRANVSLNNLDEAGEKKFEKGNTAYSTIQSYGDIVTHNAIEFALKSEIPDLSRYALDTNVIHKTGSETITGQKTFKLNNSYGNNTLDAIFANGIFIGDGMATTTSRLFNTRWCNNSFQIKTSQDIGYSYLAGSNSTNYGLKYQVQRMPSRSAQPTAAGVVEAAMCLSYDGLIVGYSEQANVKVDDNKFIYVLDQKNVKTKTIDTLTTTDKTIIGAINEVNTKPSSEAKWGSITGTISEQEDLNAALDSKQGTLVAGTNISIDPDTNTISSTSGYAEIIFRKWSDD